MIYRFLPPSLVGAFALLALIIAPGCGDESTGPADEVAPTFASITTNIFEKNCTTSSCHGELGQRGGLILEGPDVYNNLVWITPSNLAASSKGLKLVMPGNPDSSFLLIKLTGPGIDEGDRMPQGNSQISAQAIEAIRTWISNGARRE